MATNRKKTQRQTKETMDKWNTTIDLERLEVTDQEERCTGSRLLEVGDKGSQNSCRVLFRATS